MAASDPMICARNGIQPLLHRLRTHLNLDVAFVSELTDELRVIHYADAATPHARTRVGACIPREDSYCHYVTLGQLPQLLSDASRHPLAAGLGLTEPLGIGSHVSVPIVLGDGTVYGTLGGFAHHVDETIDEAQLTGVRLMAELVADYLDEAETRWSELERRRQRLRDVAVSRDLTMLMQPIVRLATDELIGVEALARFPSLEQGPAEVFDEAWQLGVGLDLEMAAVDAATNRLDLLSDDVYLAVNVAPTTLISVAFGAQAAALPAGRLVAEVTERAVIDDAQLDDAPRQLGRWGARFAVDDVGTGFSGLERILRTSPDILKIDKALVRGIDTCLARQAMVGALTAFTDRMGTTTVAEGIETAAELATLNTLGVDCGQGYHLARPCEPHQLATDRLTVESADTPAKSPVRA